MHVSVSNGVAIKSIGEQLGAVDIGLSPNVVRAICIHKSGINLMSYYIFWVIMIRIIYVLVISILVPSHIGMTFNFGPTLKLYSVNGFKTRVCRYFILLEVLNQQKRTAKSAKFLRATQ